MLHRAVLIVLLLLLVATTTTTTTVFSSYVVASDVEHVRTTLSAGPAQQQRPLPIVISHRGSSGERPEHTLGAYELAITEGVDFVELDLVITGDGVLIASHSNELSETTNIEEFPQFASRKSTKNIGGQWMTGWFTEDFQYQELTQLRVKQRFPERGHFFDNIYPLVTAREALQLLEARADQHAYDEDGNKLEASTQPANATTTTNNNNNQKRRAGVYIELKTPAYFRAIGLPMEDKLIELLQEFNYTTTSGTTNSSSHDSAAGAAADQTMHKKEVFIQCFESTTLKYIRAKAPALRTVMLIDVDLLALQNDTGLPVGQLVTPEGLAELSQYCDGLGLNKQFVVRVDGDVPLPTSAPEIIQQAHDLGMVVHMWTFRNEPRFRNSNFDSPAAELELYFKFGIDGVFSDFPATAVSVRASYFNLSATTTTTDDDDDDDDSSNNGMVDKLTMVRIIIVSNSILLGVVLLLVLFVKYLSKRRAQARKDTRDHDPEAEHAEFLPKLAGMGGSSDGATRNSNNNNNSQLNNHNHNHNHNGIELEEQL